MGAVGTAIPQVDEVIAPGLSPLERRLVLAGGRLHEFHRRPLEVGIDDVAANLEEVEELVVLVEGVHDDLDSPLIAAHGKRQVAGINRPH